ncbi:DUF5677 domain-containing protein [Methanoregula sp.]|uniref:DUF5677 domain-containing protein n=1 Tax=Methanoregula sp. TaxID=2052170 RepID=UPI002CA8F3F2|nr:DUF5677 domain-containing protein [Methanoregula sp.]HVP97268.1 DUF5677 domain-containing protein [Methanoregula sp.]
MIEKIFGYYYAYIKNKQINNEKKIHIKNVHTVESQKNLKKYRQKLEKIAFDLNHLIYDFNDIGKMSLERQFVLLSALKLRDLFESILLLIGIRKYHSIFPLIRTLIESEFLLIYVQKNPDYVKQFMESEEIRQKSVHEIRNAIKNDKLNKVWSGYSDIVHINPGSFRLTQYKWKKPMEFGLITQDPLDLDKKLDNFMITIIPLMEMAIRLLEEIQSKTITK